MSLTTQRATRFVTLLFLAACQAAEDDARRLAAIDAACDAAQVAASEAGRADGRACLCPFQDYAADVYATSASEVAGVDAACVEAGGDCAATVEAWYATCWARYYIVECTLEASQRCSEVCYAN